ncbi:MAG: hypothetical protein DSY80_04150 [Desulfocapsa sp.]|nr:MAG: hypothetical protein DSY80_04150 [Desulfocapsa sp.]
MGAYSRWDDWLVAEHEMIERAMEVLKTNLGKVSSGTFDKVQTGRAIDFLLEFGDKIHNIKEEKFLFPRMHERGVPVDGGPIGVMIMEHDMERNLLVKMQMGLDGLSAASGDDQASFVKEGLEYLTIRGEHIWKENDILYNMARQMLNDDDFAYLLDEFKKSDVQHYGEEASSKFETMLKEVEEGGKKMRLVENLSTDQLHAIMETLPMEVTFVDADDTVAYFNRLDKEKIFARTRSVIGRKVHKCHPEKSVDTVLKIVEGFKNKTMDTAEFWIDFRDEKVLIRYFPVFNDDDEYMGVLEVTQEVAWIQKLEGQKLLLD